MGKRNVGELMVGAYKDGVLSQDSMDSLAALPEIGSRIEEGLGAASKADFLVTVMPDDSFSIETDEMQKAVRAGHNAVLDVAKEQAASCLVHTRYLNGRVLNPYIAAKRAKSMTARNYELSPWGTPLYDQSVILLGTVLAKWREAPEDARPRTLSVIISDGVDTTSSSCTPGSVKWLVGDMLLSGDHIIAAMGINDGQTDFRRVFGKMGIPEAWILTPDASAEQIAKAFRRIAHALELAADSEQQFRQLTSGLPPD